ncbi:MAG: hypothetical protein JXB60_01915 [Candidatus Cloacimonetes bacterium]|nr:hypothetical protein [Candidatus Cloacimonadota bacterium]
MQYAVRNTIILAVLLLIVIVGFTISNTRQKKILEGYTSQHEDLLRELDNLIKANPDYNNIEKIIKEYEQLKIKARETSKTIPRTNNPSVSYLYLLDLCDNFSPRIDFDFKMIENKQAEVSYNLYSLNGTANIFAFYDFIYQLENQPMFYTIEALRLQEYLMEEEEMTDRNMVEFELDIKAYYDSTSTEPEGFQFRELHYTNLDYNPFLTRVYEPAVDLEEEKFLNLDTSYMIGLTPEKVFLRDEREVINIISPGDRVAYGYLDRIEWEEQAAVFKINKTGVTMERKIFLNID